VESLYLLVPIALIFIAVAIRLLFWAVNNGQYEDLDTEAHRILFDEENSAGTEPQFDVESQLSVKPHDGEKHNAIDKLRN